MSSSRNAILATAVCALVEQAHAACTVPSSPPTGYSVDDTSGQNLDPNNFVSPTVTCTAGRGPTGTGPTAVVCGTDGTDYTFAGCTRGCIAPAAGTTGYLVGGDTYYATWNANVACVSNYHSVGSGPAITQCSAAGQEYGVSGCAADECVRPTSGQVGPGIDFSGATETLTKFNFSVSGLSCATGYTGTISSASLACSGAHGSSYTLTNSCSPMTCTGYANDAAMPTGYVQGSNYAETTLTAPTLTIAGVECAPGYTGTPQAAACTSDNSGYVLTGCSAETSNSFARVSAGSQVALLVGALVSAVLVF